MGEDGHAISDWIWEDNKLFELALAVVDEGSPNRWEAVASMLGNKSAGEVEDHYDVLLKDLNFIESGKLDYMFGEALEVKELSVALTLRKAKSDMWSLDKMNSD